MPRPQFTLRALLVLLLAVACFFGGIRCERERQRREDEAVASDAAKAQRGAAAFRARQRMALVALEQRKRHGQIVAAVAARERMKHELAEQEKKINHLMDRFKSLTAEESDQFPIRPGGLDAELDALLLKELQHDGSRLPRKRKPQKVKLIEETFDKFDLPEILETPSA